MEECCICKDEMLSTQNIETTKCNHKFHNACLEIWKNRVASCPLCRTELEVKEMSDDVILPSDVTSGMNWIFLRRQFDLRNDERYIIERYPIVRWNWRAFL